MADAIEVKGFQLGKATRDAFGAALKDVGGQNQNIVVVDGDVGNSTRTFAFRDAYPDRFFEMGIAESNMVSVASGLTAAGKVALVSSFAVFLLDNAYDQIRMGVSFPNLNVKLVGSHAGISIGEDGPSQMAVEDLALASSFPHFTVLVPADEVATRELTRLMFEHTGPVYMRTGRPQAPLVYGNGHSNMKFDLGKAINLRDGKDVTIIACGLMVAAALAAAETLSGQGIQARVLDMHTIKPLDIDAVRRAAQETGAIVTAEEHLLDGGLGSAVARVAAQNTPVPIEFVGIHDRYAESGAPMELMKAFHLMPDDVVEAVNRVMKRKKQ